MGARPGRARGTDTHRPVQGFTCVVEQRVVDVLGPDQPKRMIEAAASMPQARRGKRRSDEDLEMWALLFELAFETGMREGERYALMPYELELRDGQPGIHVRADPTLRQTRDGGQYPTRWRPRTSPARYGSRPRTRAARRFVPTEDRVVESVVGLDQANNIGMRDFVFTSARGNPVCSSTERYQWMKPLRRRRPGPAPLRRPSDGDVSALREQQQHAHERQCPGPPAWKACTSGDRTATPPLAAWPMVVADTDFGGGDGGG